MKKFSVILLSFLFLATLGGISFAQDVTVSRAARKTASLGEQCGGPQKIPCTGGYLCEFEKDTQTTNGICVDTVQRTKDARSFWARTMIAIKKLFGVPDPSECPDIKAPVCGNINGQLHGLQNKCQLERHGGTYVHDWFCKVDKEQVGTCAGKAYGIGTCFNSFAGYEFDGNSCVKRYLTGCEAQIPFQTQEECERTCK